MKVIIKKQLHSCFASGSTSDRTLQKILELNFIPPIGMEVGSQNWDGGTIKELYYDIEKNEVHCWVEPDETYYDVHKDFSFHATKEQMDTLVDKYVKYGWIEEK